MFSWELRNKSASRDDDSSGGKSKVARVLTQPTKPELLFGKRATPRSELSSGRKLVRRQRVLTNVCSLGEIQLVDTTPEWRRARKCDALFEREVGEVIIWAA